MWRLAETARSQATRTQGEFPDLCTGFICIFLSHILLIGVLPTGKCGIGKYKGRIISKIIQFDHLPDSSH